ncbi:MAG: YfiR family protein, partial [Limisphaerales bacterium]
PIIIGVFGKDPFQGELESIVKNKTINGHPLAVRKINRLPNLKQCRIVFISASEAGHLTAIFREISGAPILTVGDRNGFIRAGGMIQFVTEQNEIRFEINDEAARRTGLKISSKLLMLSIRLKQNDG